MHRDAIRDVMVMTTGEDNEELTAAPDQKRGDITRTVATHRATTVTSKVTMRQLPTKRSGHGVATRIVTNERTYVVEALRLPGASKSPTLYTARGKVIECDGLDHQRNDKLKTVSFSVPRSCMGNPRWVRIGVGVFRMNHGPKTFFDDSHRDGLAGPWTI
ncbi:hypothetical protein, partial [Nocardioides sp.]|uniref:hypothetical protein n=1 Tax=Nocardioides sp. TaxID=35761 RepID=UPI0027343BEC